MFSYTVGSGFRGDVAVDVFSITDGLCMADRHHSVELPGNQGMTFMAGISSVIFGSLVNSKLPKDLTINNNMELNDLRIMIF